MAEGPGVLAAASFGERLFEQYDRAVEILDVGPLAVKG
jgi:hypothetical protein